MRWICCCCCGCCCMIESNEVDVEVVVEVDVDVEPEADAEVDESRPVLPCATTRNCCRCCCCSGLVFVVAVFVLTVVLVVAVAVVVMAAADADGDRRYLQAKQSFRNATPPRHCTSLSYSHMQQPQYNSTYLCFVTVLSVRSVLSPMSSPPVLGVVCVEMLRRAVARTSGPIIS